MNTRNSQRNKKKTDGGTTEQKLFLRNIHFSSPIGELPTISSTKFAAFECGNDGQHCAFNSKIPRPPLTASNSFNETLKPNQRNGKTKLPPSMIPRSNLRKNENDKIKFDEPSKTESKNFSRSCRVTSSSDFFNRNSNAVLSSEGPHNKTGFGDDREGNIQKKKTTISSLVIKFYHDFVEGVQDAFQASPKDKSLCFQSRIDAPISRKGQEIKGPPEPSPVVKIEDNSERETKRQERAIRNLYHTVKHTSGPLFDNLIWNVPESLPNFVTEKISTTKHGQKNKVNWVPEAINVQGRYDFTLKEISNIWKNTISLIGSVKDHALSFVEQKGKTIDKEQLTLEAEMVQLALDFAISYSRLKTDFLIKFAQQELNVKNFERSKLENFMNSKTFAPTYNEEDLAAMARTVEDLNVSLLKGEDLDWE